MIDHLGINCSDLPAAAAFYDKVLGTLGYARILDFELAIGYGKDKPDFDDLYVDIGASDVEAVCHTVQPGESA